MGPAPPRGWWEWSPLKSAVEQLLARGDVVCTDRRGFRRVYRLAEHAVPERLLAQDLDDEACMASLVALAATSLGVATSDDLAAYFRLPQRGLRAAAEAAGLIPATVRGWGRPAWVAPTAALDARMPRHPAVLLSPFDSLVWHRPRTERLFSFQLRLEAYTPVAMREHGYFVMPLLAGGRLAGRVDPKREGTLLRARRVSLDAPAISAMAEALHTAARWVGCTSVVVDQVVPVALAGPLRAALAAA